MNQKTKLILALSQIQNLTNLLENNQYQDHLYAHLISIEVELKRQLTNDQLSTKLEK
jgi:hypothetical protein